MFSIQKVAIITSAPTTPCMLVRTGRLMLNGEVISTLGVERTSLQLSDKRQITLAECPGSWNYDKVPLLVWSHATACFNSNVQSDQFSYFGT